MGSVTTTGVACGSMGRWGGETRSDSDLAHRPSGGPFNRFGGRWEVGAVTF
ncbi:hypothetical protein RE6C_01425 [Rhodopirellula europaea 6C]|uniref:Uncharacterized protein n=1 Tax=Rhodopirellula europaea 6C TaxID=1263867 RepID=M2A858_9BACT|nr:hypothetical protein RE6C_01425 [Rhodopirellula europaea 6C]